ncbi:hypothetical protein DY000_02000090 [Brassica cretica]|uniref:CAND6/7 N-terminal domain-containing protein n=1 Tax=Brassica cretica TaxID=69181 RepID=A0ABQ7C0C7_BRACR|nr:hypothetical protein DY000_02000090 [Brassica cretica]
MTRLTFFAALISLLLATLAVAEIKSITISDDSRPVIFLQTFGFTQVEQGSLHQVDLELQQKSSFCVLDSHYVHHFNHSYQVTSPGYYSLFFANCVPGAKVSMKFTTEMYNLDPNGSKNYLPAGSTQLPDWSFVFSLCYLTFFGLWVYFCYNKKLRIHVLIAALLLMKALSLVCAAEVEFYLRTTGTPHGWNIPFYVFHFIGKVLLFVVIWSFLKPNKRMLIMVIAFQVIGVMGSIVGGETGSYIQNWSLWTHIFSFGEVFCWVWIISSSSSMKRERPNNPASNHTKCRLGQDNNPNK